MCVVSMIGSHYGDKWTDPSNPWWKPNIGFDPNPGLPMPMIPVPTVFNPNPPISRQEFDDLKREVENLKELLIKAIEYDKVNAQPHCEMEEKFEVIKKVADMVGVDLSDILKFEKGVDK